MKVLFITWSLSGGGAERVTSVLANSFESHGLDVSILLIGSHSQQYDLSAGIQVIWIPTKHSHGLRALFDRVRGIRKAVYSICPNVVITVSDFVEVVLANLYRDYRVIMSLRDSPDEVRCSNPIKEAIFKKIRFHGYQMSHAVVFQTEYAKSCIQRQCKCTGVVIPNPVSDELPYRDKPRGRIIFACSRLVKQKNVQLIINAFARLKSKHPDVRLRIAGDGPEKDKLHSLANSLHLDVDDIFIGHIKNPFPEMQQAYMFVTASDYEGMSNSLIEAMCMGLPCVATDCSGGGASSVINDGVNGLLVPRNDLNQFTKAIERYLDNPEFANSCGKRAYGLRGELKIDNVARQWLSLVE